MSLVLNVLLLICGLISAVAGVSGKTVEEEPRTLPWYRRLTREGKTAIFLWVLALILGVCEKFTSKSEADEEKQAAAQVAQKQHAEDQRKIDDQNERIGKLNAELQESTRKISSCDFNLGLANERLKKLTEATRTLDVHIANSGDVVTVRVVREMKAALMQPLPSIENPIKTKLDNIAQRLEGKIITSAAMKSSFEAAALDLVTNPTFRTEVAKHVGPHLMLLLSTVCPKSGHDLDASAPGLPQETDAQVIEGTR